MNALFQKEVMIINGISQHNLLPIDTTPSLLQNFVSKYTNEPFKKNHSFDPQSLTNLGKDNSLIIAVKPLNLADEINDLMKSLHNALRPDGRLIVLAETTIADKLRLKKKYPSPLNHCIYFLIFIFHRFLPKLTSLTGRLYSKFRRNKYKYYTKAEILGRMIYGGFSIEDRQEENGILITVLKKGSHTATLSHPSTGIVFRMKRIGKNGNLINVYKLRSMYAYSEYLQEYINRFHGLEASGKFNNDFRVSTIGKFIRKYWLDELPMIINLLKGDIKLVGVRPLSRHYFSLYPAAVQQLRIHHKPGLIPSAYADSPHKSLQDVVDSEMKYMKAYQRKPLWTDIRYIFKCMHTIFFKKVRSK